MQRLISFGSDAPELAVVPLEFRHPAVEPHASPDEQGAPDAVEVVPEEPVTEIMGCLIDMGRILSF